MEGNFLNSDPQARMGDPHLSVPPYISQVIFLIGAGIDDIGSMHDGMSGTGRYRLHAWTGCPGPQQIQEGPGGALQDFGLHHMPRREKHPGLHLNHLPGDVVPPSS